MLKLHHSLKSTLELYSIFCYISYTTLVGFSYTGKEDYMSTVTKMKYGPRKLRTIPWIISLVSLFVCKLDFVPSTLCSTFNVGESRIV